MPTSDPTLLETEVVNINPATDQVETHVEAPQETTTQTTEQVETQTKAPVDDKISLADFLKGGNSDEPASAKPLVSKPGLNQESAKEPVVSLDGIDEADLPIFKKMANDAKQRMATLYRDHKKLKSEFEAAQKQASQPQAWHEHPDAYVLMPDFKQAVNLRRQAQEENNFWRQQYEAIREGKEWLDLVPDGKGGVATQQMQPSAKAEAEVLSYILETQRVAGEQDSKLASLRDTFTSGHKRVVATIEDASKKFFPQEYQDFQQARTNDPYVKTMAESLDSLGLQKNPLYKTVCNLYSLVMKSQIKQIKQTEKPNSITAKDVQAGAVSPKPADLVSFDEFKKAKGDF